MFLMTYSAHAGLRVAQVIFYSPSMPGWRLPKLTFLTACPETYSHSRTTGAADMGLRGLHAPLKQAIARRLILDVNFVLIFILVVIKFRPWDAIRQRRPPRAP